MKTKIEKDEKTKRCWIRYGYEVSSLLVGPSVTGVYFVTNYLGHVGVPGQIFFPTWKVVTGAYSDQRETTGDTWNTPKRCLF